jgi:hypothetical protein
MARATLIKAARKDIWQKGATDEKGKVNKSIPNPEGDTLVVKKGESYYKWKFRYGGVHISKEHPKPSQLTNNPFFQTIYGIQERMKILTPDDSLPQSIEDILSEVETLKDECQERLDSMPEQLQTSSEAGNILSERISGLDDFYNELNDISHEEHDEESMKSEIEDEEPNGESIETRLEEKILEYYESMLEQVQEISFNL